MYKYYYMNIIPVHSVDPPGSVSNITFTMRTLNDNLSEVRTQLTRICSSIYTFTSGPKVPERFNFLNYIQLSLHDKENFLTLYCLVCNIQLHFTNKFIVQGLLCNTDKH